MFELDLTRQAVAERAGVTPDTVGDFLAGRRWPQNASLLRIENALEWPVGHLVRVASGDVPSSTGSVSAEGHGVLLDLPDSALEGLSEAEKQEVIARAKAEALRAAREIRRELDDPR
jgi:transcriptional regulator with XRE-family HTH domain